MQNSHPISRRQLGRLAVASAAALWLPRSAWSRANLGGDAFSLGVASGSPTHDSVVLWTRLMADANVSLHPSTGPVTVRWEVADDDKFKRVVRRGQAQAVPELAHSVHAEVDGLPPDRWYFYRFMVDAAVSPVGSTRTLPAAGARVNRLRIGYASCQKWEDGYFTAWRHMLAENLDAVLFLGDYIYEYPGASGRVRRPSGGWAVNLDDYRRRYALYKGDADLQAMHAACPWLMTWDDHDVQNDYAGLQAGNSGSADPSSPADFEARRGAAYQAYYEHMPLRASVLTRALAGLTKPGGIRIYSRLQVGRLMSIALLDDRQYRDPQVCTRGGKTGASLVDPAQCKQWSDPRRTLLGLGQEQWLDSALASRESRESSWNVIAQQTVFGQRDFRPGPGELFTNDGWDGYASARSRVTDALQRHVVPNPVLLGGDVHANWVGHVKSDYTRPDSEAVGVEFCGTSITSRGGGNDKLPERLAENPHFVFADAKSHGYGVAEFTPAQMTTTLRVVDDVTRRDTQVQTLAAFRVQAGRPVVERV